MKYNKNLPGMLIRKYRLEQNMSQETLCKGICAVSYLSKIEKGTVLCSDEILTKLFDVLGISIPESAEDLEPFAEKIEDCFNHFVLLDKEGAADILAQILPKRHHLLHSYLAIDMMLLEAYSAYDQYDDKTDLGSLFSELLQYEDYMNNLQTYRLYMLLGNFETRIRKDYGAGLNYYKLAQNRKSDGVVLESLAIAHYLLGNYLDSITLGDIAYGKLMEEGYIDRAITLCSVIAAAYANFRNINKMLEYYKRILALNNVTKSQNQIAQVYYNIGSAYLATHDYAKALSNLEKSFEILKNQPQDADSYLLLLQKLFLTQMGLKSKEQAHGYLSLFSEFYSTISENKITQSLKVSFQWMKMMYHNANYLQDENYLQAIKTLYDSALKDSHRGFHLFYGNYLIEAYKMQRKYKEALKITEDLFVKTSFS